MAKVLSRKVTIFINGKEVENTIKSLEAEAAKLRAQQRNLVIGSEEYIETSRKLREIKDVLAQQKNAVEGVADAYGEARKKAAEWSNIVVGMKTLWQKGSDLFNWLKGFSDEAARMDDVYADVMKTTGLTRDEVLRLNETFKGMDTRTAREELNKLASEAGKLGIQGVEGVAAFTEAADKIKVALGEDLGEDATTVIGKMAEVYTRSTAELAGAGDLGEKMLRIGSAINSLGAASSAAEPHMVDFLARLGGMASQAGLSAQQVLGYASALDQSGVSVEKSATAFQNFMAKMMQKPAEFAAIARQGVNEFRQLMETDMDAAIKAVLAGLNEEGGMTKLAPLFKDLQLSGQGVTTMLTTLKGSIDKVNEAQTIANTQMSTGSSIEEEFATKNSTMQARLEKAKDTFHDTAETLGNALYPAMITITNAGSGLTKGLSWYIELMTQSKAVLIGTLAVMGNWLRIMLMKSNVVKLFTGGLKTMLGVEKLQGHQEDISAAKIARKAAAEERARLKTIESRIAAEKKIATMKVEAYNYDALTQKLLAQERIRDLETMKQRQATVATEAHTKSIQAQKAAFASTPWGLIITALTTIATVIAGIVRNSDRWKLKQTLNETARQAGEAEGKIKFLFNTLRDATAGSEDYKKALDELKAAYPDLIAKHINERGEIENLTDAYNELAAAARQSVYDRMYAEEVGKLQGELAQQLQKTLNGISNWVDTTMYKFTEAERTAVKQTMNAIARQFAEGTLTEEQALNKMNAAMIKAKGLSSDAHVVYTGLLDGLDKKIKAVDRATNNLKTKLNANEADPFGVEKMNLEQLNAELTRSLNLQRSYQRAVDSGRDGYAERLDNETRKVEVLRKQIAKLEAQKGNADVGGDIGNYTTGETEKERKKREKREAREAKRIADAWEKAQDDAKKMTDKFNLQAESGLQKVKDDVDAKTEEMIARLRETVEEAGESADDLEKKLKEAAENYKKTEVDKYISKLTDTYVKMADRIGDTDGFGRLTTESNRLKDSLGEIDKAILQAEADLGKVSGSQRQELQWLIDDYKELKSEITGELLQRQKDNPPLTEVEFEQQWSEERQEFEMVPKLKVNKAKLQKMGEDAAKGLQDAIDGIEIEATPFEKWCDAQLDLIGNFASRATSILSSINTILDNIGDQELVEMRRRNEEETATLDEQLEQQLISQEEYNERKKALDKEYSDKEKEIRKEQWERNKWLSASEAAIEGALAILKALNDKTIPSTAARIAMAAAVGALTTAQILAITSQPEPYAKGGYVPRRTVYQAGEAGPEWVASNSLLNDPVTAPVIEALETYQRGNRRALADIPMAQINMPVATAAARELGRRRSLPEGRLSEALPAINPNVSVTMPQNDEMIQLWRELATYLKDPKNRQAVISRQRMEDFEKQEQFLLDRARLQ